MPDSNQEMGRRIRRLRTNILGINSQQEFADRLGNVTRGAVGNWERGKGIKRDNLKLIADTFDVSLEWLVAGKGEPQNGTLTTQLSISGKTTQVPVKGYVEAGKLQFVDGWGAADMEYVPSSGDYPPDWQYALIVNGESLNRTARDGDRLICLDLIKSQVAIEHNDLVIVERQQFGGQTVERTAKRVRQTTRGIELWPDSDHPDHQEAIPYEPNGDPEHNSVEVVAKVIWVLHRP